VEVLLLGVLLSLIDMYIRPKLAGKYADIHPFNIPSRIHMWTTCFGIVGFIIGPLVLGVTYAAVVAYKKENQYNNP
jgi:predicted PurR-regulated permease PerM